MKKIVAVILLSGLPLLGVASLPTVALSLKGHLICAEVSNTDVLRKKGLSGHMPLTDQQGMVFVFSDHVRQYFWMHEMNFPVDIIWINSDHTIAGISPNLPICLPKAYCRDYSSQTPVKYALEINAKLAKKWRLQTGDRVTWLSSCNFTASDS